MAVRLTTTKRAAVEGGIKILTYGLSGAGKTKLISTMPGSTVILSAEAGLLSLREFDIPAIEVSTIADVHEAYQFIANSAEGRAFENVCLDSVSEIAEVVLSAEKKASADPRKAYGALSEQLGDLVRAFRDLSGRNVYVTAKMDRVKDESTGAMLYTPSAPGRTVGPMLPYLFDEVFALRVEKDAEGNDTRWLQTRRDFSYDAKDRSGALDPFEPADLGAIFTKIRGGMRESTPLPQHEAGPIAASAANPVAASAAETQGA